MPRKPFFKWQLLKYLCSIRGGITSTKLNKVFHRTPASTVCSTLSWLRDAGYIREVGDNSPIVWEVVPGKGPPEDWVDPGLPVPNTPAQSENPVERGITIDDLMDYVVDLKNKYTSLLKKHEQLKLRIAQGRTDFGDLLDH